MTDETIKILFTEQREALKELVNANSTLTRATIKAETDRVEGKIEAVQGAVDRIEKHNEKQNGTLAKHDEVLREFGRFHRVAKFFTKRPILTLFLLIMTVTVFNWMGTHINFQKTVEKITGIALSDSTINEIIK